MPTNPLIFDLSPESADAAIHDLGSPHLTLRDVAELYETTIQALTLWMARPDIAERLANINSAVVMRSRHVACNYFARATEAVITSIDAYIDEEKHIPTRPTSIEDREQRRRSRQTACHSVSLLLRIAKFNPLPAAGRAGEGLASGTRQRKPRPAESNHKNRISEILDTLGAPPAPTSEDALASVGAPTTLQDTSPSISPQSRARDLRATAGSPPSRASRPFPRSTLPTRPLPKRGDPDYEPWMSNGETPLSPCQANPTFTPITISAPHSNGGPHTHPP